MAKSKSLCRAANGIFVRNIGWKQTASGFAQHKFYLGRDEHQARVASLRLEQLWDEIVRFWRGLDYDARTARPVWSEETFAIADAIRSGQTVVHLAPPPDVHDALTVNLWLGDLRRTHTCIHIELADPETQKAVTELNRHFALEMIDRGRELLREQQPSGDSLLAALEAYGVWIEKHFRGLDDRRTAWGGTQSRHVAFIRRHLPDVPLAELDAQRIDEVLDVLRRRPLGEAGKRVSVAWTRNCIKQFRHFLRWLNKSSSFSWKRPADLEVTRMSIPRVPQELGILARSSQVQTHTEDELKTLWTYGSPFHRVLMLLSLNCGFGRAEIASLEMTEVLLHQKHPRSSELGLASTETDSWIFRVRHKSSVYGEWKLWPETVAGITWWLKRRQAIAGSPENTTLLLNRKGQRFDTPTKGNHQNLQIPNTWFALVRQIRKDSPGFRALSFNKLRKTGGNLVRQRAGGELAGVFLAHGTPMKSDELLDLYTNRPFAKVFEAIDAVGEGLRSLWAAVPVPFPEEEASRSPNISLGTTKRIASMIAQGYKVSYVATTLGVSTETVRRWAKRSVDGGELSPQ